MSAGAIVILTGAGISAESGIAPFRDKGGVWENNAVDDVAAPDAFARDPDRVHAFYNMRRSAMAGVQPNAAHEALARLESDHGSDVLIVTQNVDTLHEQAGSKRLIHMHGQLDQALCTHCSSKTVWRGDLDTKTPCPNCSRIGGMRPDIVWFGEYPYRMEEIWDALGMCDLFVSIGTSGNVYPAAQFVQQAARNRAQTLELNLEPSAGASDFDEAVYGPASETVPDFVGRILADQE